MSTEDYIKAYKSGKRDYQARLLRGVRPTLEVLDDILPEKVDYSEVPLGLVQIPAEQIWERRLWAEAMPLQEIICLFFTRRQSLPASSHSQYKSCGGGDPGAD